MVKGQEPPGTWRGVRRFERAREAVLTPCEEPGPDAFSYGPSSVKTRTRTQAHSHPRQCATACTCSKQALAAHAPRHNTKTCRRARAQVTLACSTADSWADGRRGAGGVQGRRARNSAAPHTCLLTPPQHHAPSPCACAARRLLQGPIAARGPSAVQRWPSPAGRLPAGRPRRSLVTCEQPLRFRV